MDTFIYLLFSFKVLTLLTGLSFAYMGYRLFMADKIQPAGDFGGAHASSKFTLRNAAPGTFFSFFGTVLIVVSLLRGMNYDEGYVAPATGSDASPRYEELPNPAATPEAYGLPRQLPKSSVSP